jgi:hypothetical protein
MPGSHCRQQQQHIVVVIAAAFAIIQPCISTSQTSQQCTDSLQDVAGDKQTLCLS